MLRHSLGMPPSNPRALPGALLILSVVLVGVVILPFAPALFLAAVLGGALFPVCTRLARRLGGRRKLAASILTLAVVVAFVLPLGGVTAFLVAMVADAVEWVRSILESQGLQGLVDRLPRSLRGVGERVVDSMPDDGAGIESLPTGQGGNAAAAVGGVVGAATRGLIQTAMFLVAYFFFLVDGDRLVRFLDAQRPFRRVHVAELLHDFRRASVAVLVSTVATAGIQALVALFGFLVARVPNVAFFTLATFFLGMIPAIGAASVPVALGVLLLLAGKWVAGAFLVGYGLLVVALVDNVVKPYLIKGGVELHGAVVFFALLGGLAAFGGVGLVAGPLIVVFFVSALKIYERETTSDPIARAVPPPPPPP